MEHTSYKSAVYPPEKYVSMPVVHSFGERVIASTGDT
jgi:hypothetical protein